MLDTYGIDTQDFFRLAMRHLLEESSLTQGAVAEHLGIAKTTVNDFLNKRRNFPDAKREAIAEFLGTSHVDMLILGRHLSQGHAPLEADASGTVHDFPPRWAKPRPPAQLTEAPPGADESGAPSAPEPDARGDDDDDGPPDSQYPETSEDAERRISDLDPTIQKMVKMLEQLEEADRRAVFGTTEERLAAKQLREEVRLLREVIDSQNKAG